MEEEPRRSSLHSEGFVQLLSLPSSLKPMGTPASVASEPPSAWQGPEPRARKKASANIFQDIDLPQLQDLFQTSGDKRAKERAQIVWDCAGDSRLAEALMQLQRRRRSRRILHQHTVRAGSNSIGVLSIHHFSQLCIEDGTEEHAAASSTHGRDKQSGAMQRTVAADRVVRKKHRKGQQDTSAYLHQIRH
ncbi:arginine vasopressin-induced protein 1 [Microcaecilia unicolor]|uniref:Arginine vasopressin-induced protein 1 n=1 Tax=Microcaecilia unicolor TaxID=1415580 RepID=A0A6P7Y1Q2_9AMPH|nr:arginine vasopressin-induced protein 1 [Microcaecilia unicolor]